MDPIPFSDPENVIDPDRPCRRAPWLRLGLGQRPHDYRELCARRVSGAAALLELLVTYAYLASITKTLRFGTGILVLPMRRDIVATAKQICTLDHFSGGRVELGVGIGAYREEFKAVQPDSTMQRGDIVDEGLQALSLLFHQRVSSFDGQFYKYRDVELWPKPLQKKLPILVGGNNPNNIRRAVQYGDGWLPAGCT